MGNDRYGGVIIHWRDPLTPFALSDSRYVRLSLPEFVYVLPCRDLPKPLLWLSFAECGSVWLRSPTIRTTRFVILAPESRFVGIGTRMPLHTTR
jgi:hypothetical protein